MHARHLLVVSLASLGLALAAQPGFAATRDGHLVTHAQLHQISQGDSAARVSDVLGAPSDVTRWQGGRQSMDYEISSHNDMQQLVYVNLDRNNKVTGVQIISRD